MTEPVNIARSRAERYLAARLLALGHEPERVPPGLDPTVMSRQRQVALDAGLDVYRQLDLLDDDDVRAWRDAASRDHVVRLPARSDPKALEMLERRHAEAQRVMWQAGPEADAAASAFFTSHLAAASAGLLSEEDARAVRNRFEDSRAASIDDRRRLELARSAELRDLRAVIAGPARGPSGLTLVSVEVFADALVVHWRRRTDASDQAFPGLLDSSLTDDVGTTYLPFSGGGGGAGRGNTDAYGTLVFGPAPPRDAKNLELVLADDRFDVILESPGRIE